MYKPTMLGKHIAKIIASEKSTTLPSDIAAPIITKEQKRILKLMSAILL